MSGRAKMEEDGCCRVQGVLGHREEAKISFENLKVVLIKESIDLYKII